MPPPRAADTLSPGGDRREWNTYVRLCCAAWQDRMVSRAQDRALWKAMAMESRLSWVSSPYRLYTVHEPKAELF